ncbi:MAG TPA: hypothetical protein VGK38_15890 [Prolixibacteraceae bacterium]|jgi:hypothetical protein
MGIFNFFRRRQIVSDNNGSENSSSNLPLVIPKDTFIDENDSKQKQGLLAINGLDNGIDLVYQFLQADTESKGYSDALVNADESFKLDNIRLIKLDLEILIDKTYTYYDNLISEINLHISTRSRAGLVDLVKELESRKILIMDYKQKLLVLKESINDENGMCQRCILSYQRGFMRGLSALTQSNVLNKRI